MSRNLTQEIHDLIHQHQVVLFMKGNRHTPQCGFSATVVQCLQALGAEFTDINILEDALMREAIKAFSNWPTIPQLYIGGEFVGGCDIVRELYHSGELKKLLAASKPMA